ncbi:hypothetical protein AKJ17_07130 [Vibrio nereis]|uniref:Chitin-binding type-3 domain-containing protein n=2 Tax=Vibrio nereis TaxID=693 RepID=A0A0M0HS02_VIBNE|nr:hypothetical protein AKJ17_07130 [Vibrio nereis]
MVASTALSANMAFANELPAGTHILTTTEDRINYYDKQGQLLASQQHFFSESTGYLRDLVHTPYGTALYYGTFDASLALVKDEETTHYYSEGLSTANNTTYGGIAVLGRYAYLTDMKTNNAESKGIVRFDLENKGESQAFFTDRDYIDITVGNDGLLYALHNRYGALDVIEPVTMKRVKQLELGHTSSSRAVTATQTGEVLMASLDGHLYRYDASGNLLTRQEIETYLADIDINEQGDLLISTSDVVYLLDESGQIKNTISQGFNSVGFAAFASVRSNFAPVLKVSDLPITLKVNEPVLVDLRDSYDPEGHALAFDWSLEADQLQVKTVEPGLYELKATKPGNYQVSWMASDGQADAWKEMLVEASGSSPAEAVFNTTEIKLNVGQTFLLDGSASYDPDGDPLTAMLTPFTGLQVTDGEEPLTWNISATQPGEYQFNVQLYDGEYITEQSISVTVEQNQCGTDSQAADYPAWQQGQIYTNQKVSYQGLIWQAKWWNKNQEPGFSGPWTLVSEVELPWTEERAYLAGEQAEYNGYVYRTRWWSKGDVPGQAAVWEQVGPAKGC